MPQEISAGAMRDLLAGDMQTNAGDGRWLDLVPALLRQGDISGGQIKVGRWRQLSDRMATRLGHLIGISEKKRLSPPIKQDSLTRCWARG